MATTGPPTGQGHHHQPPPPSQHSTNYPNHASPPSNNKRDLKSWWRSFKLPSRNQEPQETRAPGIFGVPLRHSISYANVAISLIDENGQSYIYGYVPIVVAKCGVYLKEKATSVEGIFRLSGSEKRIKELKTIFDSPDRYGKGLVWDGYTVHDAANVLRRYLNDLPEPVVPLDLYEKFREPLRGATKQAVGDADGPQFVEHFNEAAAIDRYQRLITELPPLNRQLLLYLLDLLAVFAAKADENRMNSQNLAAIFQPGMLSHPTHDMSPEEYRLNQCVIIFLIENQDHFLIGMQGTGTDEKTVQEIESGGVGSVLVTTPSNNESGLGRSSSNASAGAQSVRKDGQLRRNRSVASRHSGGNDGTSPNSPALSPTPTNGGLGRSNTVPSKKSPAIAGGKFKRSEFIANANTPSPTLLEPLTPAIPETPRLSEQSNLTPAMGGAAMSGSAAGRSQEKLLGIPQDSPVTPQKDRHYQSLFQRSPVDESKKTPNKLKKKRIPGSMNPSAQSSSTSLTHHGPLTPPGADLVANPMDQAVLQEADRQYQLSLQQQTNPSSENMPRGVQHPHSDNTLHPNDDGFKGSKSPPTSVHSGYNDGSDLEHGGESHTTGSGEPIERERRSRWKIGRMKDSHHDGAGVASTESFSRLNDNADRSTASLGLSSQKQRKPSSDHADSGPPGSDQQSLQDSGKEGREETKGAIGWFKNKMREAKETAEQRRTKSPPAPTHGHGSMTRGKSLDIRREPTEKTAQRQTDKPVDAAANVVEKPAEKAVETTQQKPTEVPTATPGTQPAGEVIPEVPQELQAEKTVVEPAAPAPSEKPADQPTHEPAPPIQPIQPAVEQAIPEESVPADSSATTETAKQS